MTAGCVFALLVGGVAATNAYPALSKGRIGYVANVEGSDVDAFKPQGCTAPGCTTVDAPGLSLVECKSKCQDNAGCKSLAHCTGNQRANFNRCYLKGADFSVKQHSTHDCTTYRMSYPFGSEPLMAAGLVANNEGVAIASYKQDCDGTGSCHNTTSMETTLHFCQETCAETSNCHSFAFCTGNPDAQFRRCYTKGRDFGVKQHSTEDCTTYFKQELAAVENVTLPTTAPVVTIATDAEPVTLPTIAPVVTSAADAPTALPAGAPPRLYSLAPKIDGQGRGHWQVGAMALGGAAGLVAVALLAKRVSPGQVSEPDEAFVLEEGVE